MAYRVTGKSLVEEEKRIKGAVYYKIKIQVERKNAKEILEKERWVREVLRLHLQERWRLNLAKNQDQDMKERKLNQKA